MKSLIIFTAAILLQCIPASLQAQYDSRKVDSLRYNGDVQSYKSYIQSALADDSTNAKLQLHYAEVLALNNQPDSAFLILAKLTMSGASEKIATSPAFIFLRKYFPAKWAMIEATVLKNFARANPNLTDTALVRNLWTVLATDQAYYMEIAMVKRSLGRSSTVVFALWDLKTRLNEENLKSVKSLINKHGWITAENVGPTAANAAYMVLLHSGDAAVYRKYLPILKKRCSEKREPCENYALMYDKYMITTEKPQLFGSQTTFNSKTGQIEPWIIYDEANVDKRRREMGMQPLETYLKMMGSNYKVKAN